MVHVQEILGMKVCVIIPAYNEAKNIADIVRRVNQQKLEILIIDDGSIDNTYEIAENNGAIVIRNALNQGKGAALIMGFNYVLEKNFDAVITMDGDGQHLPEEIPHFIKTAQYSKSGVFIGNRMLGIKNMPFTRVLTNKFMSWLISLIAKQKIPDSQCGFRLIKREVLKNIQLNTRKYETESEILIEASRLGFKIEPLPVKTIYAGEKSQINPFLDTLRFIRFISKEIWTTRS